MDKKSQALYDYAYKYRVDAENSGRGTQYPTMKECADALKSNVGHIYQLAEDMKYNGENVDIIVGIASGNGYGVFKKKSDHQIEVYEDN